MTGQISTKKTRQIATKIGSVALRGARFAGSTDPILYAICLFFFLSKFDNSFSPTKFGGRNLPNLTSKTNKFHENFFINEKKYKIGLSRLFAFKTKTGVWGLAPAGRCVNPVYDAIRGVGREREARLPIKSGRAIGARGARRYAHYN